MTTTPITEARLLTVDEVADFAQLHVCTIRQEIHEGRLPAFRFGNYYRIEPDALEPWLETRRVACTNVGEAVPLRRDASAEKTSFGRVAREVAGRNGPSKAAPVHHESQG